MKQILTKIALATALLGSLNAADKFADLTKDYLDTSATVSVKKVIAQDSETSRKTLEILTNDSNKEVRDLAQKNLR